ncbi:MAG: YlmC/YmxH family sporulation protein [Thermaerobacter sp.]|nr:YlmC/YmxH family sporulation protein [Bacillota bacterium]REJ33612.1 MAG: YlmC/YmxH family sporulation protein [Bacillota bacterium]
MDKLSDLTRRDVINFVDGRRLGYVDDVAFHPDDGRITAIIVPGPARFFGLFGRDRDLVIPWERILKIGEDVIIVEIGQRRHPRRSRRWRDEDDDESVP